MALKSTVNTCVIEPFHCFRGILASDRGKDWCYELGGTPSFRACCLSWSLFCILLDCACHVQPSFSVVSR